MILPRSISSLSEIAPDNQVTICQYLPEFSVSQNLNTQETDNKVTTEVSVLQNLNTQKTLKFLNWNIHGLTDFKLAVHTDFLRTHDFILLTESWTSEYSDFYIEDFEFKNYHRPKKNPLARRFSGGLSMFVRRDIRDGIDFAIKKRDWIVWSTVEQTQEGIF